ncbi:hypothetical protein PPERSA_01300 [Pseudocohnilembus persalinus]|uniref:DHHA1 domain-containing protein n=1 Tax=Pseudocohnilembus persalinus TaxID=266149 RepID=A0A0V0QH64_PSEPJ|nr:hypothetical protein PPERSA_01300 [Pseudocohnilembus persalinus]|eukprot:KRX01397.1 hypothetical protein PPERSA_01300 [Pseudocohnilembus persalinus]
MPKSILEKLKQLNIYVQDYDIKTKVHNDSEAFVAGLYSMKIQLNAKVNPVLFHNFLCYPTDQMIHKGRLVLEKVEEDVKNLLDKKKDIIYFGGKLNPIAKCYAIKSKDTTLYNTLGAQLSLASLKDGLDHMGAVYSDSSQGKKLIKVSLRASLENFGICNVVASKYGGGGHERAASFFISSDTFRQWLK